MKPLRLVAVVLVLLGPHACDRAADDPGAFGQAEAGDSSPTPELKDGVLVFAESYGSECRKGGYPGIQVDSSNRKMLFSHSYQASDQRCPGPGPDTDYHSVAFTIGRDLGNGLWEIDLWSIAQIGAAPPEGTVTLSDGWSYTVVASGAAADGRSTLTFGDLTADPARDGTTHRRRPTRLQSVVFRSSSELSAPTSKALR